MSVTMDLCIRFVVQFVISVSVSSQHCQYTACEKSLTCRFDVKVFFC